MPPKALTLIACFAVGVNIPERGVSITGIYRKSYNMVNGYVQNRQQPRLEVLFEIAEILGVKPKDLIKDKK